MMLIHAVQNAAKLAGRFVLRPSPIAGLGVFTSEGVAAKEILLEYQGPPFNRIVATPEMWWTSYFRASASTHLFAAFVAIRKTFCSSYQT